MTHLIKNNYMIIIYAVNALAIAALIVHFYFTQKRVNRLRLEYIDNLEDLKTELGLIRTDELVAAWKTIEDQRKVIAKLKEQNDTSK